MQPRNLFRVTRPLSPVPSALPCPCHGNSLEVAVSAWVPYTHTYLLCLNLSPQCRGASSFSAKSPREPTAAGQEDATPGPAGTEQSDLTQGGQLRCLVPLWEIEPIEGTLGKHPKVGIMRNAVPCLPSQGCSGDSVTGDAR